MKIWKKKLANHFAQRIGLHGSGRMGSAVPHAGSGHGPLWQPGDCLAQTTHLARAAQPTPTGSQ
jgi:hypothetical protein